VIKTKGVTSEIDFSVSGLTLKPVACVKLLGVIIDDLLSFDTHVSTICKRLAYQTNALRRIAKFMTLENRVSVYNAFLASNFNYSNTVWHFCSYGSTYKLEKAHKKVLQVVLNDYNSSYRILLGAVSRPPLYITRMKAIAMEAYKCYKKINPDYINVMLNSVSKPYDLRGGSYADQPKVNTTHFGLDTFSYQAAKIWNIIPAKIKNAVSLPQFKIYINEWQGPVCHCGTCVLCKIYDI